MAKERKKLKRMIGEPSITRLSRLVKELFNLTRTFVRDSINLMKAWRDSDISDSYEQSREAGLWR